MLDELEGQIVTVPVGPESPDELDVIASTEVNVHRAIYKETSALAILHGHSKYAVVCQCRKRKYLINFKTKVVS